MTTVLGYQIVEQIYEGSNSLIYRARREPALDTPPGVNSRGGSFRWGY